MFFAWTVLKTGWGRAIIAAIAGLFTKLYTAADGGIAFVFGKLADPSAPWGFVFAVKVLPVIVFFGALMSLLFYLGIIQFIVQGMNRAIDLFLARLGQRRFVLLLIVFLVKLRHRFLLRTIFLA